MSTYIQLYTGASEPLSSSTGVAPPGGAVGPKALHSAPSFHSSHTHLTGLFCLVQAGDQSRFKREPGRRVSSQPVTLGPLQARVCRTRPALGSDHRACLGLLKPVMVLKNHQQLPV